ncbi:pyridoxal phosphate-dependent transferase [Delphinella strobiligena]|nr:pyridoxal phosphate-dependent transferase [Delphinella strobiligena]
MTSTFQRSIAPVTGSDLFKTSKCFSRPKGKRFDLLFSREARMRLPSSLKTSGQSLTSDIISLSTGRPSSQYFPINGMSFDFSGPCRKEPGAADDARTECTVEMDDVQTKDSAIDLAISLNYGYSAGAEQLVKFVTEHVEIFHDPPYSDWESCLTIGSTSALDLAFRTLASPGDSVLVEKYTYSGTIECAKPLGLNLQAVDMDDHGMSATHLDEIMDTWEAVKGSQPKPRLLYTIPTGQNPTGVTQDLQRRHEIYAVAEKHNLFIIEDDPYYYLQYPSDESSSDKQMNLLPSFLALDKSGRVLRLDSTSKILAPGLRCGWMTGPSHIIRPFFDLHDLSITCPSGLSQLMMYKLLGETWGHSGFSDWLHHLRTQYHSRMQSILLACEAHLPRTLCSWQAPSSGMFFSIRVNAQLHPLAATKTPLEIQDLIADKALANGVLCCKGSNFVAGDEYPLAEMFFRLTFATASTPQLQEGIRRFGLALKESFELAQ